MASPFSYQMPSWHEDAPFPIEGNIVNNLASAPWTSGTQLPLLAMYMAQRSAGQRGYQDELAQQHDFAAQALAAHNAHETQANALKLMELKNPGALRYAASNPNMQGLVAGTDPGASANYANEAERAYSANIIGDLGKGLQGMQEAGMRIPLPEAGAVAGTNMEGYVPSRVQAAEVKAASGGGGGGSKDRYEVQYGADGQPTGWKQISKGSPPTSLTGGLPPTMLPPAKGKPGTRPINPNGPQPR